jgi:hypothetical protein
MINIYTIMKWKFSYQKTKGMSKIQDISFSMIPHLFQNESDYLHEDNSHLNRTQTVAKSTNVQGQNNLKIKQL